MLTLQRTQTTPCGYKQNASERNTFVPSNQSHRKYVDTCRYAIRKPPFAKGIKHQSLKYRPKLGRYIPVRTGQNRKKHGRGSSHSCGRRLLPFSFISPSSTLKLSVLMLTAELWKLVRMSPLFSPWFRDRTAKACPVRTGFLNLAKHNITIL